MYCGTSFLSRKFCKLIKLNTNSSPLLFLLKPQDPDEITRYGGAVELWNPNRTLASLYVKIIASFIYIIL